jgi:transcriptional regulator with XRE-family HTH domain
MPELRLSTPQEIARELGQRLRAHRLALNITQQELATRAGVALGALKQLEAGGNPTLQTWLRTVQALGLVQELSALHLPPGQDPTGRPTSIASMQKNAALAQRQRARRP